MNQQWWLQRRALNLAGFAACAGLMAYALYAEHVLGLAPCPLCVFQRLAVIALGIGFLAAALHDPRRRGARFYGLGIGALALTGAGIAAWHVRLQNLPPDQVPACGPGLDFMLQAFPLTEVLSMVFTSAGECAEVHWTFLGLSMPAWVLVSCLALGGFGVWANWRSGEAQPVAAVSRSAAGA